MTFTTRSLSLFLGALCAVPGAFAGPTQGNGGSGVEYTNGWVYFDVIGVANVTQDSYWEAELRDTMNSFNSASQVALETLKSSRDPELVAYRDEFLAHFESSVGADQQVDVRPVLYSPKGGFQMFAFYEPASGKIAVSHQSWPKSVVLSGDAVARVSIAFQMHALRAAHSASIKMDDAQPRSAHLGNKVAAEYLKTTATKADQ